MGLDSRPKLTKRRPASVHDDDEDGELNDGNDVFDDDADTFNLM